MKTMQARWYHKGRLRPIRLIVAHDMEWPENVTAAEDCARMFATMDRQASAHVCVDSDSAVRCVADSDTAWAAPGANADGLQVEIAGFVRQTREEWLDPYSLAALGQAAKVAAAWCEKYGIPVRHLTLAELTAGKKGFIGHVDATRAYGGSHTDPGPGFPWDTFLDLVNHYLKGDPAPVRTWTERLVKALPLLRLGDDNYDVKTLRAALFARGRVPASAYGAPVTYGMPADLKAWIERTRFDAQLDGLVRDFQEAAGLAVDGVVGEKTWAAALRVAA